MSLTWNMLAYHSCQDERWCGWCWHQENLQPDTTAENTRKKPNKKAGKKQPRPCDNSSPIVNPAPDSAVKRKRSSESDSDDEPLAALPPTPNTVGELPTGRKTPCRQSAEKRHRTSNSPATSDIPVCLNSYAKRKKLSVSRKENNPPCALHRTPKSILKKTPTSEKKGYSRHANSKRRLQFAMDPNKESPISEICDIDSTGDNHIGVSQSPCPRDESVIQVESTPITKIQITAVIHSPPLVPQVTAWVDHGKLSLSQQHKETIERSGKLDCDIINYCQKLLLREHPSMYGLQDTRLVPVIDNDTWIYRTPFSPVKGTAVQILHTGDDHWITSVAVDKSRVYVYDSLLSEKRPLSNSTQIQLSKLYGNSLCEVKIRLPRVQQQQNGVDCGVFAIAFATEFCFAKKELSKSLIFDTKLMRPHLIQCIEFGKFTPFPKRRSSVPPKRLSLSKKDVEITISKNCKSAGCDLPDLFDDMTNCDRCQKWYHNCCVGISENNSQSFSWSCDECQK